MASERDSKLSHGSSRIRTGIGGWVFPPWRGLFYPDDLVQKRELEYASRQVSSIEINGTYYRAPEATTYRKWASQTPEGFVFSVKAPRHIVQTKQLATAGGHIKRFLEVASSLGDRLGPILWQFMATRPFDPDDMAAFLDLLPEEADGVTLRHAVEARSESFMDERWLALARDRGVATVFTDSPKHPSFADLTGPFVYARLMRSRATEQSGYPAGELKDWAKRTATWAEGRDPADLPHVMPKPGDARATDVPRDVFVYFISAAKERNPSAAVALGKLVDNT